MCDDDYEYSEVICEALAEAYEATLYGGASGGGKKKQTTMGRKRDGGVSWGTTEKVCPKECKKKCCVPLKN